MHFRTECEPTWRRSPPLGSDGSWKKQQTLPTPSTELSLALEDPQGRDHLGESVGLEGGRILAGTPHEQASLEKNIFRGTVEAISNERGSFARESTLTACDAQGQDLYGTSVAVDSKTAVVGAINHTTSGTGSLDGGAAYIHAREGGRWTGRFKVAPSEQQDFRKYGAEVEVSGDTVMVGAPEYAVWGEEGTGDGEEFDVSVPGRRSCGSERRGRRGVESDCRHTTILGRSGAACGFLGSAG